MALTLVPSTNQVVTIELVTYGEPIVVTVRFLVRIPILLLPNPLQACWPCF